MTVWNTANVLLSAQLMTFAMVFSLWYDRIGEFEVGLEIAMLMMLAAMVVLVAPGIQTAYEKVREKVA